MMEMEPRGKSYSQIAQSKEFRALIAEKKKFIIPVTIFFFTFYFALPILTSYTTVLNNQFYGDITWAWVFAFSQFIMTWTLCILYSRKARKFDEMAEEVLKKN